MNIYKAIVTLQDGSQSEYRFTDAGPRNAFYRKAIAHPAVRAVDMPASAPTYTHSRDAMADLLALVPMPENPANGEADDDGDAVGRMMGTNQ
jgi:hypothetical protein